MKLKSFYAHNTHNKSKSENETAKPPSGSLPPQQQSKGFYNRKSEGATRSRSAKSSYFNEKIPPALTLWCRRPTIMAAVTPFAPYTNVDTTLCNRLPMRK